MAVEMRAQIRFGIVGVNYRDIAPAEKIFDFEQQLRKALLA